MIEELLARAESMGELENVGEADESVCSRLLLEPNELPAVTRHWPTFAPLARRGLLTSFDAEGWLDPHQHALLVWLILSRAGLDVHASDRWSSEGLLIEVKLADSGVLRMLSGQARQTDWCDIDLVVATVNAALEQRPLSCHSLPTGSQEAVLALLPDSACDELVRELGAVDPSTTPRRLSPDELVHETGAGDQESERAVLRDALLEAMVDGEIAFDRYLELDALCEELGLDPDTLEEIIAEEHARRQAASS